MQRIASAIAIAAVLVAGALVLRTRLPNDESAPIVLPAAIEAATPTDEPPTVTVARSPSAETAVAAKVRELETMSETYRNTTFVIAIRDAGFVCNELLRVSGGLDDSPKWLATCSDTLAYTIGVASNGTLHIEPFEQYFDGIGVRTIDRQLPPEPLPQPR